MTENPHQSPGTGAIDHEIDRRGIVKTGVGLNAAARETLRQYFSSASRAPAVPPAVQPSVSTAAFIAPADVPDMPAI